MDSDKHSDSSLIISQEDAKVFSILVPPKKNLSQFDEIAGMIANAQYSLQKHQFIEKYTQEDGQAPPIEHVRSIILSFKDENSAAFYNLKQKSESLLKDYAREYLNNTTGEEILKPVEQIIKKYTRFRTSVGANLVAAMVYSLAIALAIFIATAAVPDTKFAKIIKILIEKPKIEKTIEKERYFDDGKRRLNKLFN